MTGNKYKYGSPVAVASIAVFIITIVTLIIVSTPSDTVAAKKLMVFVRGTDNSVYYREWDGNVWSDWQGLGGNITSRITATSSATDITIFGSGTDNGLWTQDWNGSAWSGWQRIGGNVTSDITSAS
ncbi:Uncharacterised protein [uncultured archaeon]|nr:Uncharacterised protein [uncultured archaeon]